MDCIEWLRIKYARWIFQLLFDEFNFRFVESTVRIIKALATCTAAENGLSERYCHFIRTQKWKILNEWVNNLQPLNYEIQFLLRCQHVRTAYIRHHFNWINLTKKWNIFHFMHENAHFYRMFKHKQREAKQKKIPKNIRFVCAIHFIQNLLKPESRKILYDMRFNWPNRFT